MQLSDQIMEIKGIGEKSASLFHKLNIYTVSQLLFHIPKGFETLKDSVPLKDCQNQEMVSVMGFLKPATLKTKKGSRYTVSSAYIICGDDLLQIRLFNMPYIKNILLPNQAYIFRGIVQIESGYYKMTQPKIYKETDYNELCGKLQPIYVLTKGLTNHTIQKSLKNAFDSISPLDDFLTDNTRIELEMPSLRQAIWDIHFPPTEEAFILARKRLVFNEFFLFLLQMRHSDTKCLLRPFPKPLIAVSDTKRLIESLPYELTNAQKKVWMEIENDLQKDVSMNRLIQGDVGSGKTIIAFLALLMNAANNHQGCMMAPTEVLAKQHYDALVKMADDNHLCIHPALLLGSMSAKNKRDIKVGIENGSYNVIIGTQALIQASVSYHNLTLVITDEQHRFGVKQRENLVNKGEDVHVLVMSATPIPRTLAMILYSNLSISVLNELPAGRLPIKNCVVDDKFRKKSYHFMLGEINKGKQAYIICPMVESSDDDDLENVIDYTEKLKESFPKEIIITFLHGKMSLNEKNEIMERFSRQEIDILVSTTVIEVGINVPNATVIMIENASRYGLSQLHQLRGRVGRGKEQSYCIFINNQQNENTKKRLGILLESNDGFYIADKDLSLRGPGDLFGIRQSGELGFVIGDIYQDSSILMQASQYIKGMARDEIENLMVKLKPLNLNTVDFRTI